MEAEALRLEAEAIQKLPLPYLAYNQAEIDLHYFIFQ